MNMKSKCLIALLTLSLSYAHAQLIKIEDYKWPAIPEKIVADKQFSDASAVVLKDVRLYNFYYDKSKKDDLVLEQTHHKIIQINDTRAIEVYNKLYIPLTDVNEVLDIQARTISPDGKITDLDKDKIRELSNKDGEGAYKIYAFEGLEKGSRLEYFYRVREEVDYSLRNFVQSTDPVQLHQFEVVTPSNLTYEHKTYNGISETIDTVIDGKRYTLLTSRNIPGLDEEKYSAYEANLMRHEAQLAYNSSAGTKRVLSYASTVQRSYQIFYEIDPKIKKEVKKISKDLGLAKMDTKEKIKHIENFVKTKITIDKKRSPELEDLSLILRNKEADHTGIIRLFINLFEANGINCQLVFTTDRNKIEFDPNFESLNYLSEMLFYFPDVNEFIDPTDITYRYPFISAQYTLNSALFVEEISVGKYKAATYSIKKIHDQDPSMNGEEITADCRFTPGMDSLDIHFERAFLGQMAAPYRLVFNLVPEDDKKKGLDEIMKYCMADGRIVKDNVENLDFLAAEKPVVTKGEVVGSALLEKTGKDVIFKLGDILGPQVELYQEKARITPIDVFFAHNLNRTVKLHVPDGYKLSGLDGIKMDVKFDYKGKKACGFVSDYTLANNVLTVTIKEYYYTVQLPKTEFENFRKVINASADFNKVNVVLEKL